MVFPQGAFEDGGWLYISYGGADKVVALARVRKAALLDALSRSSAVV